MPVGNLEGGEGRAMNRGKRGGLEEQMYERKNDVATPLRMNKVAYALSFLNSITLGNAIARQNRDSVEKNLLFPIHLNGIGFVRTV